MARVLAVFLVVGFAALASVLVWRLMLRSPQATRSDIVASGTNTDGKFDAAVPAAPGPSASFADRFGFAADGTAAGGGMAGSEGSFFSRNEWALAIPAVAPPAAPGPPKTPPNDLLNDAQIANIKNTLRLTAAQETYWPPVESALRAVVQHLRVADNAASRRSTPPVRDNSADLQRLKSAASTLIAHLREDQKRELRNLTGVIGLSNLKL